MPTPVSGRGGTSIVFRSIPVPCVGRPRPSGPRSSSENQHERGAERGEHILKRDLIEEGLGQVLDKLKPAAKVESQWVFVPPTPGIARGIASLEEDWLVLSVPVSSRSRIRTSFQRGRPLVPGDPERGTGRRQQAAGRRQPALAGSAQRDLGRQRAAGRRGHRFGLPPVPGGDLHPGQTRRGATGDVHRCRAPAARSAWPSLKDMAASEGWHPGRTRQRRPGEQPGSRPPWRLPDPASPRARRSPAGLVRGPAGTGTGSGQPPGPGRAAGPGQRSVEAGAGSGLPGPRKGTACTSKSCSGLPSVRNRSS